MYKKIIITLLSIMLAISISGCKLESTVNHVLSGNNTCQIAGCTVKANPCTWDIKSMSCK